MKNTRISIAFDMDGVLADFDRAVAEVLKIDTAGLNKSSHELSDDDKARKLGLYKKIEEAGPQFWANFDFIPGALDMWNYANNNFDTVYILTAYIKTGVEKCIAGKRLWVQNKLGIEPNNVNFIATTSAKKKNFVNHTKHPNSVLIDDRITNILEWESVGGDGILFKNSEDTLKRLREIR